MNSLKDLSYPALPLELAEAVLLAAIRSIRYIRRTDSAKQVPYLTAGTRSLLPEVTKAAIARQVWVDMDHASVCGAVDLLVIMLRLGRLPEYSKSLVLHYTHKAVDVASERGRFEVLEWWVTQQEQLPVKYSAAAMDRASELGRVDVLEWWKTSSKLPLRYSSDAIRNAAKAGHVHVLDWWLLQGPFAIQTHGHLTGFIDWVGVTGQLDVLNWFIANRDAVERNWTRDPFTANMARAALDKGNVHVLDWMLEHGPECLVDNYQPDSIQAVIEKGTRTSLEWLAQRKVRIPENYGIEWAMHRKKDKALAQWLLDAGISQVSLKLFLRAFKCADADYVEWCYERLDVAMRNRITEAEKVLMFLNASSVGSVDTLSWIVKRLGCAPASLKGKQFPTIDIAGRLCTEIENCFLCASQKGHVTVLDWFVENGFSPLDPMTCQACVYIAIETGCWQVLEWLSCDPVRSAIDEAALGYVLADTLVPCAMRGFDACNESDYIRVLEWIWFRYPAAYVSGQFKSHKPFSQSAALLDWWARVIEPSPLRRNISPQPMGLDSITDAGVLKWWLSSGRSDFNCTAAAIDQASASGRVDLLDCWRQFNQTHGGNASENPSEASDHPLLKYTSAAMDNASRNGHLEMLEWWESSRIVPLKYSKRALKFTPLVAEERRAEIVRWWLSSGLP